MPDATYDVAIIGGGHNGICLASYLARAGQKVGIFERRHEEAGGVHTEEATVPGFWHNLHAQYMEFIEYMPFYRDFDLPRFGARMIKPEAQVGIAFADGRPPSSSTGRIWKRGPTAASPSSPSTTPTSSTRSGAR